jgi:DNA mismatch endonuclease (patch repair protein)
MKTAKDNVWRYDPPTAAVSKRMRLIASSDTKLEKHMRTMLRSSGIRFRHQPRIKGNPDFRLVGMKIVIFCDSSFWHGRFRIHADTFKRNADFWAAKIRRNRKRDRLVSRTLSASGWQVLRFWDSEILHAPEAVTARITREVEAYLPPPLSIEYVGNS